MSSVHALGDDMPTMHCPQCKAEHPDFDGFGMVAHTKPAYPDGCGYCTHPSRDGTYKDGALHWRCGICGDVQVSPAHRVGSRQAPYGTSKPHDRDSCPLE
jgi:hypothetical protein